MASHFSSDSQGTVICNPDNDTASHSSLETTGIVVDPVGLKFLHSFCTFYMYGTKKLEGLINSGFEPQAYECLMSSQSLTIFLFLFYFFRNIKKHVFTIIE